MTTEDEKMRAAFAEQWPADAALVSLAESSRDYAIESIGARHRFAAFKEGWRLAQAQQEADEPAIQQAAGAVPEGLVSLTDTRLFELWKACKSIDNRAFCVEFGRAVIAEMRIAQSPELTCWFGNCVTVEACAEDGCKTLAASPAIEPPKQQPDSVHSGSGECGGVQVPLTEFRRMQIIGDEFPLCLVAPIVIQKIDAVCRAIEAAHGIGPAPLQGKEANHG